MPESKIHLKPDVLDSLKRHGNISRAARESKLDRRTINLWRETDSVFKAASDAALKIGRA